MRNSGGRLGLSGLVVWIVTPVVAWSGVTPLGERFDGRAAGIRSVAILFGLLGFGAWSGNIVLGARIGPIERAWDGLDHLYRAHRRVGEAVPVLLLAHGGLMLASIESLDYLDVRTGAIFLGPVVLAALILLVLVSVYGSLHRDPFVLVQRVLGGLFFFGLLHVFGVVGDKAASRTLTLTLGLMSALAAAAWIYRSLLGRRAAPRHHYAVAAMRPVGDRVTEVVLDPVDHPLTFSPGQFAFLSLGHPAHDTRPHPFSITSVPGDERLTFVVKGIGDHTRELATIPPGTSARVEGPYGSLCHERMRSRRQIWIGGGIGITPFLSMARSVSRSGPNAYRVDLFYCTAHADEAFFLSELEEHVDVITIQEDRDGFLNADIVEAFSGPLDDVDVLLCGPPGMMHALRAQLEAKGVPAGRIHAEDFTFRRLR